jgi:hypothetical protein
MACSPAEIQPGSLLDSFSHSIQEDSESSEGIASAARPALDIAELEGERYQDGGKQ